MPLEDKVKGVNSKHDLSVFIQDLKSDFDLKGKEWANSSLENFLEALSGWVNDMDGYYLNHKMSVPEQPTWQTIAEMLLAAKHYE